MVSPVNPLWVRAWGGHLLPCYPGLLKIIISFTVVYEDLQMVFFILQLILHLCLSQRDKLRREKSCSSSSKQLTFWVDALKYSKWSPMMPASRPHRDFFS